MENYPTVELHNIHLFHAALHAFCPIIPHTFDMWSSFECGKFCPKFELLNQAQSLHSCTTDKCGWGLDNRDVCIFIFYFQLNRTGQNPCTVITPTLTSVINMGKDLVKTVKTLELFSRNQTSHLCHSFKTMTTIWLPKTAAHNVYGLSVRSHYHFLFTSLRMYTLGLLPIPWTLKNPCEQNGKLSVLQSHSWS